MKATDIITRKSEEIMKEFQDQIDSLLLSSDSRDQRIGRIQEALKSSGIDQMITNEFSRVSTKEARASVVADILNITTYTILCSVCVSGGFVSSNPAVMDGVRRAAMQIMDEAAKAACKNMVKMMIELKAGMDPFK